ncbi:hypothetical protein SLA2020_133780 [Shorea laevis]
MVQRTVLKVDVSCFKCKKKILKAVSSLQDPYEIMVRTRKAGKFDEVVSVGPPPPPPKPDAQKKSDEKKPDEKKAQVHVPQPHTGPICERMALVSLDRHEDPNAASSIL